jgi:hypothetical protein
MTSLLFLRDQGFAALQVLLDEGILNLGDSLL